MIVDHVKSDNVSLNESLLRRMKPEIHVDRCGNRLKDITHLARDMSNPNFKYIPRQANKVAHHIAHGSGFIMFQIIC